MYMLYLFFEKRLKYKNRYLGVMGNVHSVLYTLYTHRFFPKGF